jgi:2-polyprenyl-6-methoxyphenol hydroxylase-like FAD-dependent oxidoreductase
MLLIVGAGIAGVAAAKALEDRGIQSEIVERSSHTPTGGAAIFLLGNATRALKRLGVLSEIQMFAHRVTRQRIFDTNGQLLNEVSTDAAWKECGPCLALSRQSLLDVLLSSLRATPVHFGKSVVVIKARGSKSEVRFSDGSTGEYDAVIGADGIRSSVRGIVFDAEPPRELGITCWRFITDNRFGIDGWTAMLGHKRSLLAIPISKTKVYVYADCSTSLMPRPSVPALKVLFQDFRAPLGDILSQAPEVSDAYCSPLEEVTMKRWVKGNVVLIGDAAHASSPSMAQGAGMALEDALVLADRISEGSGVAISLGQFIEQRTGRIEWVQKQCHARDALRNSPRFVRNTLLQHLGNRLYNRSYRPLMLEP